MEKEIIKELESMIAQKKVGAIRAIIWNTKMRNKSWRRRM